MLIHKKCGEVVSVDLTGRFRILAYPILGSDCVHASSNIEIAEIKNDNIAENFYCRHCNETVEKNNILVKCSICKSSCEPKDIFQVDDAIMYVCSACGSRYSLDGLTQLGNIL